MSDTETLTTAKRIKIARVEAGMTQRQLADKTGIDQGEISKMERGIGNPTGATVDRIMSVLGQSHALAAVDGVLGIQGRTKGKLLPVDLMAEPKPVEWIVEEFVARGFVTMLAGEAGAGKSMTTQTVAEALVAGAPETIGMKIHHRTVNETCEDCAGTGETESYEAMTTDPAAKPIECSTCAGVGRIERVDSRVLALDAENADNVIQERAQNMGLTEQDSERYLVSVSDGFDIYNDRAALEAILSEYRQAETPIDLLVIDSWCSLWSGNENNAEQVQRCIGYLNKLAERFALGILLIHHMEKDGDTYRGSSAIAATLGGALFTFARYDEKLDADPAARSLGCKKMRIAAEPRPRRLYLTGHGVDTEPTSAVRMATAN